MHRQIKDELRAKEEGLSLTSAFPMVALGVMCCPKGGQQRLFFRVGHGHMPPPLSGKMQHMRVHVPPQVATTLHAMRMRSNEELAADIPPPYLKKACFVYVWRSRCVPPLVPAYFVPYEVDQKAAKTFTLRVGSCEEVL
jgi:hypothetical protein